MEIGVHGSRAEYVRPSGSVDRAPGMRNEPEVFPELTRGDPILFSTKVLPTARPSYRPSALLRCPPESLQDLALWALTEFLERSFTYLPDTFPSHAHH